MYSEQGHHKGTPVFLRIITVSLIFIALQLFDFGVFPFFVFIDKPIA